MRSLGRTSATSPRTGLPRDLGGSPRSSVSRGRPQPSTGWRRSASAA